MCIVLAYLPLGDVEQDEGEDAVEVLRRELGAAARVQVEDRLSVALRQVLKAELLLHLHASTSNAQGRRCRDGPANLVASSSKNFQRKLVVKIQRSCSTTETHHFVVVDLPVVAEPEVWQ